MGKNNVFLSLRWKLTILFGSVFLILQSVFAFVSYFNAQENFENIRKSIEIDHVNIAETLTNDAFLVLEQFAELASELVDSHQGDATTRQNPVSSMDGNWTRWQLIWDIENSAFFDKQGNMIRSWGQHLIDSDDKVQQVLKTENPEHRVFCPENCYLQTIIPVIGTSDVTGAFSVIRSFSDVIIKYRNITRSDMGILVEGHSANNAATDNPQGQWKHTLSGMTQPDKNLPIFDFITKHYAIDYFIQSSQRIELNHATYEVRVLPIQLANGNGKPPYFLFINEITQEMATLKADLKRIWLYSFAGLLFSLFVVLLILYVVLQPITRLSKALPLLSTNDFESFRKQIEQKHAFIFSYDELDLLGITAINLASQLEKFEQEKRSHSFNLMEKSQELAKERDFIKQLIELAPIIIIIQKLNGIIVTINHAGIEALETERDTIIGKVFDVFIPETDQGHLKKLDRLRSGEFGNQIQLDGLLSSENGKLHDFSWLHKLLPPKHQGEEPLVLTLGLDISERKIAEARNIRMAYYDYLTGLGNRRKFQEEFAQKLASAKRYGYQLALCYLDLDRFKEINDSSGHEAGDNFLKLVASALKEVIRSTDLLCRLGGDEFTLLMPHADVSGVEHIAKKINLLLKGLEFEANNKIFSPSTSIGVALYPLHGETINELMANADLAMYRAKELGRGQHHLFDPAYDYRSKLNQTVHWRNLLEQALEKDKFILHYQPILSIKSNDISHYECLVRLQETADKILMPSDFIYHAEELGLIGKIDRSVIKKVVVQHLEFNRQGKLHKLSVNISKKSFEDPTIFDYFADLFSNPEVDQSRIIFEITDTAAISNYQSTNYLISKISSLGCILALNDFGIEYPSLHYLKNAPLDYVKIDGSLIRQLDKNDDDKSFVKDLIEMAQTYGKKTVAEYVESEDILDILKELGVDYVQGYHIGKPKGIG